MCPKSYDFQVSETGYSLGVVARDTVPSANKIRNLPELKPKQTNLETLQPKERLLCNPRAFWEI